MVNFTYKMYGLEKDYISLRHSYHLNAIIYNN